jgi:subtilisin family serine protease
VLVGFPTGNPAVAQIGYQILENFSATTLTSVVGAHRPELHDSLAIEVGLVPCKVGQQQRTINAIQKELAYRAIQQFDHQAALRADLVSALQPGSTTPFMVEPNALFATGQGGGGIDFVLDKVHLGHARSVLNLGAATSTGSGVRVGILDSGIDAAFTPASVVQRSNIMAGNNVAASSDISDGHGHGSQMANIIATVAPDADYAFGRIADASGCTTTWHLIAGLAVVRDCHVINLSIASSPQATTFACSSLSDEVVSEILATVVHDTCERDAVVVAAAGNKTVASLSYPARLEESIAVVSVNSANTLSSFSNYGTSAHNGAKHNAVFAAPGGDDAKKGAPATERVGSNAAGTKDYFGTSHAAAYASGVVALYRSGNPSHDRAQVLTALRVAADRGFAGYAAGKHGQGVIRLPLSFICWP